MKLDRFEMDIHGWLPLERLLMPRLGTRWRRRSGSRIIGEQVVCALSVVFKRGCVGSETVCHSPTTAYWFEGCFAVFGQ